MTSKVSKGGVAKGPVKLHKSVAAGASLGEAQAGALGRGGNKPPQVPAKNVK